MKENKGTESYVALIGMASAIVNIFVVITNSSPIILKPLSIAVSILLFFLSWKIISELEIIDKIRILFFLHHLEKEAYKEVRRLIKNVNKKRKSRS